MADELSQAHVLIADDAPTVRQSLRMTLAQCGINRVDAASSIGETRRRLRNAQYDVVLCDYHFVFPLPDIARAGGVGGAND